MVYNTAIVKKRSNKPIILAALIIAAVLVGLYYYNQNPLSSVDVPLTALSEKPDIHKLENGMTVTIKESRTSPLVTIQFWVHVGSRNEPKGQEGIAHIFEHIWFKGTATQPVGSFHKRVESLGGELNAMTSQDWTTYFVVVPADQFDNIFPYMVDLLLNPAFDQKEITKELEVVTEEQRFSFNEPEKFIDDQYGLLLLDKHPYRNPVIGYKDTILGATREDIIQFYKTWYVPNNMNVIVAGDVNGKDVLSQIETAFKDFEYQELPAVELPREQPITLPKYNTSLKDIGYTYIAAGFTGPAGDDKDKYAMTVLNTIFSTGESSRLQKMRQQNTIVRGSSVYIPLNDLGVLETILVVEPEKAGQAKAELILQYNKFKTELVTDEELERAKMNIRADKVRTQEEIFQVGFDMGLSWIHGQLEDHHNFMGHINSVTKEDVKRVANEYFNAYTMYELKPKL